MSFIDSSYFSNNLSLPANYQSDLQASIEFYESEFIDLIFGYELGKLIKNNDSSERIQKLINGVEYNDCFGYVKKWFGLKDKTHPFLAYFIHSEILKLNIHSFGVGGVISSTVENGVNIGVNQKIAFNWVKISQLYKKLREYIVLNLGDYPEFDLRKTLVTENTFDL